MAVIVVFLLYPISEPSYPYSTVLNDRNGNLLGASIAEDGQWRFPKPDSVPDKISTCIQYFEDKHFYKHPGINPFAIGRAIWQNIQAGEIVSGASTLTMQIARMMRGKNRTFWQKTIEMGIAIKLDLKYSKKELMIQYTSMAPFGGNVVGIEAASWRYYNRPSYLLSWGEAASLSVLPNNPGSIFPGRSEGLYLEKRNRLLNILLEYSIIDTSTYELSILEELPGKPYPIPQKVPQLLSTIEKTHSGSHILSTIDPFWQNQTSKILERHHREQMANGVENIATIVLHLKSAEVLAYIGNTNDPNADGNNIDIIQRPRSPGSSLKPILYAKALSKGQILPKTLLPDIPTFFGGFSPKNFARGYEGAVPADKALAKSLNIPFTYLLKDYTYEQFHLDLKNLGFSSINKPPDHYGLSMILGGGEVTLWDLSNAYLKMYQTLANVDIKNAFIMKEKQLKEKARLDVAALWYTFNAMTELSRPSGEENWESYSSSQLISWKTGTSFGFRDAWAIGLNGEILVGVWVGNADGEGRAGLTGINAAAPILLETIRLSNHDPKWLDKLKPPMDSKLVCKVSGFLANEFCPAIAMEVPENSENSGICHFHKEVKLDSTLRYQVNSSCYPLSSTKRDTLFILRPSIGYFYQKKNPEYIGIPPLHPKCGNVNTNPMEIIYPNSGSKIFIPLELDGSRGKVVLKASHQDPNATIFWSIGRNFYGKTETDHKIEVLLDKGPHLLMVVDDQGNTIERSFEVINSSK